jgi:hypothetical protein
MVYGNFTAPSIAPIASAKLKQSGCCRASCPEQAAGCLSPPRLGVFARDSCPNLHSNPARAKGAKSAEVSKAIQNPEREDCIRLSRRHGEHGELGIVIWFLSSVAL